MRTTPQSQGALSLLAGLPVISEPSPAFGRAANHDARPAQAAATSMAAAAEPAAVSTERLPEPLLLLADADVPVALPAPGSVPPASLDNRELDKLIGTLGRSKATWRRALLLSQWLRDSGHQLDDRLCTTVCGGEKERGKVLRSF